MTRIAVTLQTLTPTGKPSRAKGALTTYEGDEREVRAKVAQQLANFTSAKKAVLDAIHCSWSYTSQRGTVGSLQWSVRQA